MAEEAKLPVWSGRWALFLDVDGTLLDLADHPDDVRTTPRLKLLLRRARLSLGGAVALVSGRSIASLDRLFAPLLLPAAGLHGIERRSADGTVHYLPGLEERLHDAKRELMGFVEQHAGLLLEDKGAALALHYRNASALAADAERAIRAAARRTGDGFHIQPGKMVFELKPAGHDKGTAVVNFMDERPFSGRVPVFVGDDVTDEDGFAAVNRLGGLSLRVGPPADSAATYRIDGVEPLLAWLERNLLDDDKG